MRLNFFISILFVVCGCTGSDKPTGNIIGDARVSWPDTFTYLEGPFEPVVSQFDSQSLMIVVTENNNIICQVKFEPLAEDIGSEEAFRLIEANSVEANFTSITNVSVNSTPAREALSFFSQSDGTSGNSLGRWYYFSTQEIPGEISKLYTVRCVSPVSDFEEKENTIRTVLDSVSWEF